MSRPSLFRWSARWLLGGFLVLGLFALGLAVVNAVDFFPYRSALRRAYQLDAASLRRIGDACVRDEQKRLGQVQGAAIPAEYQPLKPEKVSFFEGATWFQLFSHDQITISLNIDTNHENQVITCCSTGTCEQRSRRLWERNPEFTRRMQPVGRVLTIRQGSMSSGTDWIVRPEELLVIDRTGSVGAADQLVARIPLTSAQLDTIEAGARAISAESRGRFYDGGAIDGTWLRVSFTADGSRDDDFGMANTWRDEAGPLIDAINLLVGKHDQINFRERVSGHFAGGPAEQRAMTWPEVDQRERIRIRPPWWYLWPRLGIAEN